MDGHVENHLNEPIRPHAPLTMHDVYSFSQYFCLKLKQNGRLKLNISNPSNVDHLIEIIS